MSIIRMPANLIMPHRSSRRSVLRGAAGLGLGLGAASAFGNLSAQEHDHNTPVAEGESGGGVISSDTTTETTGDATPPAGVPETPFERYNPYLDPVEPGDKEFEIVAQDRIVTIKKDVRYAAWTFNGTVPGPALRAVQGDKVKITVRNEAAMTHSVDFHSAEVSPEEGYRNVQPGETFEWEFTANYPGAYMVHCGTAPVLMHIAAGMYLPMIVDPAENMFEPATEVVLSQSEFYAMEGGPDGTYISDAEALFGQSMAHIMAFNGHASQYVDDPIRVPAGELVRIYLVNMGPNVWSSFHIVGGIFSHTYFNANPNNALEGLQALSVGPGDGACFEITFPEPGRYIAVNHAFGHAQHGAMAFFLAE
jgi:nitrite reductase (NO-forming)